VSEIAQSTTVTESAPATTSSAEAASAVIDALEQTTTSDGVEVSGDTPAPEATTETPGVVEPPATPEPAKELSEEEKLLAEFGFKQAFKPDGREHYIPRSKVLQMIGSGLKRGLEKWTGEKSTLESRTTELQGHLNEMYADVMGEPKALIEKLAGVNPKFRSLLEQPQTTAAQTPAPDAEMPQPDLTLSDGSSTYSLQGLQKLLEWNTKRVESKMEARLKPWEDRDKAQQAEREREALAQHTRGQMQEAQGWPGFGQMAADGSLSDFQQAVLDRLKQDSTTARAAGRRPSMTLREAYLEVRAERLSTDHNKVRESVLKELNQAPRSPVVTRQATDAPKVPAGASTADIAARTLDRLERGR
jgi:hypothetical protein